MQPHFKTYLYICLMVLIVGTASEALGQQEESSLKETPPLAAPDELTIESVLSRQKKIEDNTDLDPAIKTKILETYTRTLEQLKASNEANMRSQQLGKLTRESPDALITLKADLARPIAEQTQAAPVDATLPQVQQLLSVAEMNLTGADTSLKSLQDEPKRRADRRLEIPKLADAAKLQLQEIDKLLVSKPAQEEPTEVTTASRMLLESRKKAISAETTASQAELQLFEATGELLSAQRDMAARRVAEADGLVKALRVMVNERRRQEAEQQAQEARKTSAQADPAVRKIAEVNAELATQRQLLAGRIESTARELEQIDAQVATIDEQFKSISKRYDTAGATEAIGLLLRKQRDDLPEVWLHQRKIKQRSTEISNTYLELIDYEEKRNELATLDQRARKVVQDIDFTAPTDFERSYLEEEVRRVLESQRDVYDSLITDINSLLDKLVELDVRERQLISESNEYAAYCDERILWIRSATVLDPSDVHQLWTSLLWLMNPVGWQETRTALWTDVVNHPLLTSITALMFLILILSQRALRATMKQLGEQAARSNITSYLPTLRAMLTTGLLAFLWPGLLGYLGLRLLNSESGSEFVAAVGSGLRATSVVFVTLELLRHVCRHCGLGEAHFDWDEETMRLTRLTGWWFIACGLPLMLVVTMTEAQPSEVIKNSLGRFVFVGLLAVLTACVHRLMRPVGGALDRIYSIAPQAWTTKMKRFWHLLAVSAPITLGLLALGGYYYTALQLAWRLLATLWMVVGLLIVHAALIRWSLLSYRDLAMRQARDRRAAEAAAAAANASTASTAPVAKTQPLVKLSDINKQTRKALQLGFAIALVAGLWLIWVDVLPALGVLRHVELWTVESTITTGTVPTTTLLPITLANVLLAMIVASLTLTASRNLPSLLEIAVLQRLPLDPGARYAITTVCKYVITAVGFASAFSTIGIGWSKVQWLVAAISVGLGFGLQEIFANFVSGLILLFEQPVRLGDIVTVGDVTGKVTRFQMRATTITDWDMRELVVPNKEFITSRVMNWTLSSTISRMSIVVEVAYGTDPDLVRNLLLQIATRNPLVLEEPEPHALFDDFGESTLNFVLRVYMASRDVYLEMRHSLLTEIAHEFQRQNIEIAFPQRDIHIRTLVPSMEAVGMSMARRSSSASGNNTGTPKDSD